jgi:GABA permease
VPAQKIITVVSEPISADAIRSALGDDGLDEAEVLVIAPALISRLRWTLADPDPAIRRAEEVQEESVARLDAEGVDAVGDTGESDPLLAISDSLQTFEADRIVLITHPESKRNWLEEGVVDEARERFQVPVSHVVVE